MVYAGEAQVLAPDMVFFPHMILLDSDTGLSMSLGETAIVTGGDCEPISHSPRQQLVAKGRAKQRRLPLSRAGAVVCADGAGCRPCPGSDR